MSEVEGQIRDEQLDGEAEARRQFALAQIRQYPDPVLRLGAREVEEFDDGLRALIERMGLLMQEARGVGLAAPQIGISRRVLVYLPADDAPVIGLVNPRITAHSDESDSADEGCLSLGAATVIVPVERPVSITVQAQTPDGAPVTIEAEALEARVLQHEIDHLDGVLTFDRATPEARRAALAELRPQPVLQ